MHFATVCEWTFKIGYITMHPMLSDLEMNNDKTSSNRITFSINDITSKGYRHA